VAFSFKTIVETKEYSGKTIQAWKSIGRTEKNNYYLPTKNKKPLKRLG